MSRSHGRATANCFAEFAKNLEMCTPKLENSCIFTVFTCFCTFYVTCWVFLVHFLAQIFQKLSFDRTKKSTFRMSEVMSLQFQLALWGSTWKSRLRSPSKPSPRFYQRYHLSPWLETMYRTIIDHITVLDGLFLGTKSLACASNLMSHLRGIAKCQSICLCLHTQTNKISW